MSGPTCPDCGSPSIETLEDRSGWGRCGFCGWEGEGPLVEMMGSDLFDDASERFDEKKLRREEGALHILRVYVDGHTDADDTQYHLMDIFQLDRMEGVRGVPLYFFIETRVKPTPEVVERVNALKRVTDVRIHQ